MTSKIEKAGREYATRGHGAPPIYVALTWSPEQIKLMSLVIIEACTKAHLAGAQCVLEHIMGEYSPSVSAVELLLKVEELFEEKKA